MEKGFTNIRSLLGAFARALNLINRDTQHHHEQTAYIAYRLAQQMGFDPYYTRMILDGVEGFGKIADWASYHHEKLNGTGYPFHLTAEALDTGARIMAVADIFSAITEVRPYRAGMDRTQAMGVLKDGVTRGELCGRIVDLLENHYDEVDDAREAESRAVGQRYYQSLAIKNHS